MPGNASIPDIKRITSNLVFSEQDGIWYSKAKRSISYPRGGNTVCFTIEGRSFWYLHRNRCVVAVMKNFPPSGRLFDIGGGNGVVSHELEKAGVDVCLLEPGIDGALNAHSRGIRQVICSALEDAGFRDCSIPAAGLFDVLEHSEDDGAFLEMLYRLLISRGRVYITVPAHGWMWTDNDEQVGHMRRYAKQDLCRKLEIAGFRVEYATYYFAVLLLPMVLVRLLPYRLGFRKRVTQDTKKQEHLVHMGLLSGCTERMLRREAALIRLGRTQQIGVSCIAVARKK